MPKKTSQFPATGFFYGAQEYKSTADELLGSRRQPNGWMRPIYFCYSHAVELALKAFWRSHNPEVEYDHHRLIELYVKCTEKGLVIDANDRGQIEHIVSLLDRGNEESGYRYFIKPGMLADLEWTREVVTRLLQVVQPHVAQAEKDHPPGNNVIGFLTWIGKPVRQ